MDDKPMDPEKSEASQKVPTLQPVQLMVANAQAPLPGQYVTYGIAGIVLGVLCTLFGGILNHLFNKNEEQDKVLSEHRATLQKLETTMDLGFKHINEKFDEAEKREQARYSEINRRFDELRDLIKQKK